MVRIHGPPRGFALGHLSDGANVLLRGAAATAYDVQPATVREALELLGERSWSLGVAAFFVGKPGIGIAGDAAVGERLQRANVVSHEFGAGGAIEAQRNQIGVVEGRPKGFDILPGEHSAHRFDGDGNHQRNWLANLVAQVLNGEEAGFDVARVLASFEQKQIRSAFEEAAGLIKKILAEIGERDSARYADRFRRGAHRARHEARLCGGGELVGGLASEFRGAAVQLQRAIAQAVFRENDWRATKGICFDDVRAGFEVFFVDAEDDIRARDHEIFVAALEMRPAEVRGFQVHLLQHRAHCAIQDEDALAEKFAEGHALLDQVSHRSRIIPWQAIRGEGASVCGGPGEQTRIFPGPFDSSVAIWIAKVFHSSLVRLYQKCWLQGPKPRSQAASDRNSTLNDLGTRPAAAPRESSSRTARRPSSP